jgi:hypothetical protein
MKKAHPIRIAALGLLCLLPGVKPAFAQAKPAQAAVSAKSAALHTAMRKLWSDHVLWTRGYIIAALSGDPGAQSQLDRLMRNQADLGNAIVPYYGAAAGSRLTTLLKEHISVAGEVVAAAKANDNVKLKDADRRWHENATAIATFLSGANPNWKKADLVSMLNQHLALTTSEATLRLQKRWAEDVANFDKIYDQALMMADALSDGVVKHQSAKFR